MAKIDETILEAIKQLKETEFELIELDNKIKSIFKTRKSIFDNMKDWWIDITNGIAITYNFELQSRYRIYITLKVIEGKNMQTIKNMKVKLIKIIRA